MNKEIKFRAWCENHKAMYFPDEIYCFKIYNTSIAYCPHYFDDNLEYYSNKPSSEEIKIEAMQFTGLVDKKGEDIYEGDIVADDDGKTRQVKWHSMNAQFYLSNDRRYKEFNQCGQSQSDGPVMCDTIEVIGNIYETPNLIP